MDIHLSTHIMSMYIHIHTHTSFPPQTLFQLSPSVVVSPCMLCMIILSLVINLDNSSFFRCLFEESQKRVEESVHSTDSSSLQPAPAALLFIQLRCPCCILTIIMTWACTSEGSLPSQTRKEPGGCPLKTLLPSHSFS